ncbi:MAG: 50S ribosomal protein L30 [Candidatus Bathyarchaeia archaeon]
MEVAKCLAVVRLRGTVNVRKDVDDTLSMLHLNRPHHATLVPSTAPYLGMLQLVKDHVTWGEISKDVLSMLLAEKCELSGGRKLRVEDLKRYGFKSVDELAHALHELKIKLTDLRDVKPVFRLRPPSGGFKRSLKRGVGECGELGYRGEKINDLIRRML